MGRVGNATYPRSQASPIHLVIYFQVKKPELSENQKAELMKDSQAQMKLLISQGDSTAALAGINNMAGFLEAPEGDDDSSTVTCQRFLFCCCCIFKVARDLLNQNGFGGK